MIEGLKEGKVKEETYDGEVFEGTYHKGKRNGAGFLRTPKYSFEGSFKNDRPLFYTGTVTHFDENNKPFEK